MSRPLHLYRLQQIDSNIDQANSRLKEIETLLSDDINLQKAKTLATRAENILFEAQKKQRIAENKVKNQRIKIEHAESTLYGGTVRNPKELQDLQNELASLKRFLDLLEERQLEAMIEVDDANEQFQEAQNILQKLSSQTKKEHTRLIQERQQILGEHAGYNERRKKALSNIIPDDLSTYDRLRKQRAGIAVAKVEGRACNACGSTLTAALHQAARSPSQVVFCESCGRILYAT